MEIKTTNESNTRISIGLKTLIVIYLFIVITLATILFLNKVI